MVLIALQNIVRRLVDSQRILSTVDCLGQEAKVFEGVFLIDRLLEQLDRGECLETQYVALEKAGVG